MSIMVFCLKCSHGISPQAPVCPQCGDPGAGPKAFEEMKRRIVCLRRKQEELFARASHLDVVGKFIRSDRICSSCGCCFWRVNAIEKLAFDAIKEVQIAQLFGLRDDYWIQFSVDCAKCNSSIDQFPGELPFIEECVRKYGTFPSLPRISFQDQARKGAFWWVLACVAIFALGVFYHRAIGDLLGTLLGLR